MIIGVDHEGHRFETDVGSWMQLHDASILRTKDLIIPEFDKQ